jgi:hypothetical protein
MRLGVVLQMFGPSSETYLITYCTMNESTSGEKTMGFVALGSSLVVATPCVIAKISDSISSTGTG